MATFFELSNSLEILRYTLTFSLITQLVQKIFILAEDLTSIYIPKNVWIYDGLGFLDFKCDVNLQLGRAGSNVIAFATRYGSLFSCTFLLAVPLLQMEKLWHTVHRVVNLSAPTTIPRLLPFSKRNTPKRPSMFIWSLQDCILLMASPTAFIP